MADTRDGPERGAAKPVPEPEVEGGLPDLPGPLRPIVDFVARIKASVHVKLLVGFFIGAMLLLGMGILSLVAIERMNSQVDELNDLSEKVERSRQAIYHITAQSHFRAMALVCDLVETPPSDISYNDCAPDPPWNDRIASAKQEFVAQVDELDRLSPPEQDAFFTGVREADAGFALAGEKALALDEAGDPAAALEVHLAEEHEISHKLEDDLNALIDDSSAEMARTTDDFRSDRGLLRIMVGTFSGVSLVTSVALGLVLSLAFVRPVRSIDHVLASIARGDFSQRVEVPNRDEFGTLTGNLNDMTGQLASLYGDLQKKVDDQVEELKREALQRERIEQELRVAHDIQLAFLPKESPHLPGWQVEAYYQPARAVGGDFYDFIDFPDNENYRGIVVGDVSDKGVPAALVMCATRSMLRAASQRLDSPGEVLAAVNELLYKDIPPNMFVTCLYAILDIESGRLVYANAGHNLPYLRTDGGVAELRATGMPLGLMPGMTYEEKTVTLAPGDSVLFHSDGLVEAHNTEREMFGFPRLMGSVEKHPGGAQLIDLLVAELAQFTGAGWEQEDDVTLVTLQRVGTVGNDTVAAATPAESQGASGNSGRILADFTLPSEPGNERRAIERVAEAVRGLGLPAARLERLKTAVAEATMNAMEHGNKYRPDLPVSIRVLVSREALSVEIIDHGGDQPIPTPEAPDLEAKLAGAQPPRGWGLFLIKNMVDDLRVTSDETHRTVELVLKLEGDDDARKGL